MNRWIVFLFGLVGYAIGFSGLVLFVLFVGGWKVIPWNIDAQTGGALVQAIVVNLGLVALFGIQHSVMARPAFKRIWTRIIPNAAERSVYCIATAIAVFLLVYFWQPMDGIVWSFSQPRHSLRIKCLADLWLVCGSGIFVHD